MKHKKILVLICLTCSSCSIFSKSSGDLYLDKTQISFSVVNTLNNETYKYSAIKNTIYYQIEDSFILNNYGYLFTGIFDEYGVQYFDDTGLSCSGKRINESFPAILYARYNTTDNINQSGILFEDGTKVGHLTTSISSKITIDSVIWNILSNQEGTKLKFDFDFSFTIKKSDDMWASSPDNDDYLSVYISENSYDAKDKLLGKINCNDEGTYNYSITLDKDSLTRKMVFKLSTITLGYTLNIPSVNYNISIIK